jgi:hypothetical protein
MENSVSENDQENVGRASFDYKRCHTCWETWRALNCKLVGIESLKCSSEFIPVRTVEGTGIHSRRVTVSYQEVAASNQPLKVNPPDRFLEIHKVAKRAGLLDVI